MARTYCRWMRIAVTGASGFIGREIIKLAQQQGHEIIACSRRPESPVPGAHRTVQFGPDLVLNDVETVIHLAGESIMGWWTARKKERILNSRVQGTRQVVEAIARSAPVRSVYRSARYGARWCWGATAVRCR